MSISNDELIKLIKESKLKGDKLAHITNKKSLSAQDKFKISLCKIFVQCMNEKRMLVKDFSKMTGIAAPRLSEITSYKINLMTVDKILAYLEKIAAHFPKVREHMVMLEQAIELPIMKVKESKKLTRKLKNLADERNSDSGSLIHL